jgi:hypothetical protein
MVEIHQFRSILGVNHGEWLWDSYGPSSFDEINHLSFFKFLFSEIISSQKAHTHPFFWEPEFFHGTFKDGTSHLCPPDVSLSHWIPDLRSRLYDIFFAYHHSISSSFFHHLPTTHLFKQLTPCLQQSATLRHIPFHILIHFISSIWDMSSHFLLGYILILSSGNST